MMSEWQPIETAPKDGTHILLWFNVPASMFETNVAIGFWSDLADDWPEVEPWFMLECDSAPLTAFGARATHWMPLPEPPHD